MVCRSSDLNSLCTTKIATLTPCLLSHTLLQFLTVIPLICTNIEYVGTDLIYSHQLQMSEHKDKHIILLIEVSASSTINDVAEGFSHQQTTKNITTEG